MDSKKLLETLQALAKIANNQQKIIHKLAQQGQAQWGDPMSQIQVVEKENAKSAPMTAKDPTATHIAPAQHAGLGAKSIEEQVKGGVSPETAGLLSQVLSNQGQMTVYVKPGFGRAQAAEVQKAVKTLEESGAIMPGHKLQFQRG